MPDGHRTALALLLTVKKVRASKINYLVFAALPGLCGYLWIKESFETAIKFFLFLFPYVFLFLSQDMVKEEVRSGALENVVFLGGEHKAYLWRKSLILDSLALGSVGALFLGLSLFALASHRFQALYFWQFLIGILVGIYYLHLGGLVSFYLRGGSNVLILIVIQALVLLAIMFSATQPSGFIDSLDKGIFPDLISRLEFVAVVIFLPNLIIWKKFWLFSVEILILLAFLIGLQKIKFERLELKK